MDELKNATPLPENRGGAPVGNQNALKYNTPEKRQALCRKYCEYIRNGYTKEFFPECSYKTFVSYCEQFPVDFPPDVIGDAERAGLHTIETMGFAGTVGKIKGFNAMSWKFIVQNKLGWKDRQDVTTDNQKIEPMVIYKPDKLEE